MRKERRLIKETLKYKDNILKNIFSLVINYQGFSR